MSSFLCFLCHSTVSSETNDDTRDKYREVVGMHLCPDSHLCHICCHILHKLCLFRAMCLKRSLEYPVLFSEKGTINLLRSDLDNLALCEEDGCKQTSYSLNKSFYTNFNCKTYIYKYNINNDFYETGLEQTESNEYVNFDDKNAFDDVSKDCNNIADDFEDIQPQVDEHFDEYVEVNDDESTPYNYHDLESINNRTEEILAEHEIPEAEPDKGEQSPVKDLIIETGDGALEKSSSKKKGKTKKVKKKSFTKIVLSFQEQKMVLEYQRKEKKYLEAEFKCQSCALGFLFKDTYQSHMVRHEESNGQFWCEVCGLRFASQNARCMHVILHAELHHCNTCGLRVKRPHRNRHSRLCWRLAAAAATCHLCGKMFQDSNCLQQHLKRFHEVKSSQRTYSCNVCGKTYNEPAAVRTHMLKHINRRFNCPQCPSSFTSPYTLTQHRKQHHCGLTPAPAPAQYYCRLCDTWYKTQKSLNAHLNNTQPHVQNRKVNVNKESRRNKQRPRVAKAAAAYTCHMCGHQAKSLSKLNRHIKEVCERTKLEEQLASFYEQESGL